MWVSQGRDREFRPAVDIRHATVGHAEVIGSAASVCDGEVGISTADEDSTSAAVEGEDVAFV